MIAKSPKEGEKGDSPVFFACMGLYALTSLAICAGVLYLILCVPEGKLFPDKIAVEKSSQYNSILISPQELDSQVGTSSAKPSESDAVEERHFRIIDRDGNPIFNSEDSMGDPNKPRNPKQEALILDLQDIPTQVNPDEEIAGDDFYQK